MSRPITISSGQWRDVPFETLCQKMAEFGYEGIELACWGDHFDVEQALSDDSYLPRHREGPLSVEFEDPDMEREHGAREALAFVCELDFTPSKQIQR